VLLKEGGDREMVDILSMVLHHDKNAGLRAVELALESPFRTVRLARNQKLGKQFRGISKQADPIVVLRLQRMTGMRAATAEV
jgi:hypothetical protein